MHANSQLFNNAYVIPVDAGGSVLERYQFLENTFVSFAGAGRDSFGIVMDLGSSGSRVHLFHWAPHSGDPSKLLKIDSLTDSQEIPLIKKSTPGK